MPVVTSQLQLGNNANFSGGSSGYLADAPKGTVIQQAVHNTGYGAVSYTHLTLPTKRIV